MHVITVRFRPGERRAAAATEKYVLHVGNSPCTYCNTMEEEEPRFRVPTTAGRKKEMNECGPSRETLLFLAYSQ